jgi:hypothetical protein
MSSKVFTDKKPTVKIEPGTPAPIAARRTTQSARSSKNPANDFMKTISSALDPSLQAAMTSDRMAHAMQNTQILSLTNQLRDAQSMIETLRNRLSEAERERNQAERKADRAEMMALLQDRESQKSSRRRRPLRRQEIKYADGGEATMWVGSDESDHLNDSPGTRRFTFEASPEPLNSDAPSVEV